MIMTTTLYCLFDIFSSFDDFFQLGVKFDTKKLTFLLWFCLYLTLLRTGSDKGGIFQGLCRSE